jgi:hypothetical protein
LIYPELGVKLILGSAGLAVPDQLLSNLWPLPKKAKLPVPVPVVIGSMPRVTERLWPALIEKVVDAPGLLTPSTYTFH